jgi:hypothetical protein
MFAAPLSSSAVHAPGKTPGIPLDEGTQPMPIPALLLPLAAAQALGTAANAAPPPAGPHQFRRVFISPMGEPFRAAVRGEDTLADWFRQADRNHDGQISADEMQQDADRFFAILDTNHDGEIDPAETEHYEDVVAPEIRTGAGFAFAERAADGQKDGGVGQGGHGGGGHRGGGGGHRGGGGGGGGGHRGGGGGDSGNQFGGGGPEGLLGAARFGLLDLPEPVVSADTDFNRGVSLEEFRKAALLRFQALDVDHQGRLTLAVLETVGPPPPRAAHKSNASDSPDDGG